LTLSFQSTLRLTNPSVNSHSVIVHFYVSNLKVAAGKVLHVHEVGPILEAVRYSAIGPVIFSAALAVALAAYFFQILLKYPGGLVLTDLESGHKANSNSAVPAGFGSRPRAAPQISASFSPTKAAVETNLF